MLSEPLGQRLGCHGVYPSLNLPWMSWDCDELYPSIHGDELGMVLMKFAYSHIHGNVTELKIVFPMGICSNELMLFIIEFFLVTNFHIHFPAFSSKPSG